MSGSTKTEEKSDGDVLRATVFDESQPGTILRDMQTLLAYVPAEGLPAKGKHHLLPMSCLAELNSHMVHPYPIKLERPQLRSYPNLQCLYFLSRATGLLAVQGLGEKTRLVVDADVLKSYEALNPTEKYMNLLEAWILHVDLPDFRFVQGIGSLRYGVKAVSGSKSIQSCNDILLYSGIVFAFCSLFGFVELELVPGAAGKPQVKKAGRPTPLGSAMLELIQWMPNFMEIFRQRDQHVGAVPEFGRLRKIFGKYLPQWRKDIRIAPAESREGEWVFKVSLGRAWRRIGIPSRSELDGLGYAIVDAFDFGAEHLWEFVGRDHFDREIQLIRSRDCFGRATSVTCPTVGDLALGAGDSITFRFDFGDNWEFNCLLERIEPKSRARKLRILETHGEAPIQYLDDDETE